MTDSQLQLFNFEDHDVRVIVVDGEPWWVANDVCAVLEIRDASDAVQRLDEDDRGQAPVQNIRGQLVQMNIVNEPGLYALIFRSDKPMAKQFRKWVTSVVLPAIRKQGDIFSSTDALLAAVLRLRDLESEARAQHQIIVKHAARLDSIEHNSGWLTALAFAKMKKFPNTDDVTMARLGKAASWATRMDFLQEPRKTRDQRFGTVNLYPEEALEKAWKALGLGLDMAQES